MKKKSLTDWDAFNKRYDSNEPIPYDPNDEDELYDPNDAAAVEAFWASGTITRGVGQRGAQKAPTKSSVTLRLSPDTLAKFKSQGKGWQTRIDEVLTNYANQTLKNV